MDKIFERITLPSLGQCYNNSLSCGKINLYPLTGKHEDMLCSNGLKRDYLHFDLLLNDIIQNDDVDINTLLQGDIEGILLATKILAYGPKKEITVTCPHCEFDETHIINLMDFKPIESVIPKDLTYQYKDYKIKFKHYTYEIFKRSHTKIMFLKNIIEDINDGEEDIQSFIENKFLYKDYRKFIHFIESSFPRISPKINLICGKCQKPIEMPFKVDHNFFGFDGQYKLSLHKEFLSILYGSEGSFSHTELYNLPVNLRLIYTQELIDIKKKEQQKMNESSAPSSQGIARPGFSPK